MPKCPSAAQKFQFLNMFLNKTDKGDREGHIQKTKIKAVQTFTKICKTKSNSKKNKITFCVFGVRCQKSVKNSLETKFSFSNLKKKKHTDLRTVYMCVSVFLTIWMSTWQIFISFKNCEINFDFCCDLFESNRSVHFRFIFRFSHSLQFENKVFPSVEKIKEYTWRMLLGLKSFTNWQ